MGFAETITKIKELSIILQSKNIADSSFIRLIVSAKSISPP